MPNPASGNLILTAGMANSASMYRHDLASAAFAGQLPRDPHPFLALFLGLDGGMLSLPSLAGLAIGLAAQSQVAGFFASDGKIFPIRTKCFSAFVSSRRQRRCLTILGC